MPTKRIIIYWLLLLIPTLLIGGVALKLLQHEQDRIERLAHDALRQRAQNIADTITLAVSDTHDGLLRAVASLEDGDEAISRMRDWRHSNPLVRNAFVWQPGRGLVYPDPAKPATAEERRFVQRYSSLFNGDTGWLEASLDGAEGGDVAAEWETLPSGLAMNTIQEELDLDNQYLVAQHETRQEQQYYSKGRSARLELRELSQKLAVSTPSSESVKKAEARRAPAPSAPGEPGPSAERPGQAAEVVADEMATDDVAAATPTPQIAAEQTEEAPPGVADMQMAQAEAGIPAEKEDDLQGEMSRQPQIRQRREEAVATARDALAYKQADAAVAMAEPQPSAPGIPEGKGCIPWFSENRLHRLLWYRKAGQRTVRGFEVETVALLSRLMDVFPRDVAPGRTFALIDDSGKVIHQAGGIDIQANGSPLFKLPLDACLPHWYVAVYFDPAIAGPAGTDGFVVVGSLMVGIFIVAILAGGSLLLWQAYQNMLDARRKTSFVSNVSHELKTPLTSIRMYAELLGDDRVDDPAKRKRYLDVITKDSHRLTRLVNNVLDFSRLEQRRKKYEVQDVDLVQLVDEVLENQSVRLQEAGMDLSKVYGQASLQVRSDRDALEQTLLNLIDNAVKYAAEGKELTVLVEDRAKGPVIEVMDRGPGVPSGHRTRIFEKFHRVDDSLTTRQPGSGLGLSIAKRMLEDLGATITCRPRDGGGTVFSIQF